MKKLFLVLLISFMTSNIISQDLPELRLIDKSDRNSFMGKIDIGSNESYGDKTLYNKTSLYKEPFQLKKRKTVNSYFGAGYSLIIFTDNELNSIYPILDTRSGSFLTNISVFFGFAIAQALTLEFEPSLLFTNSSKNLRTTLSRPHGTSTSDTLVYSSNLSMFAIPLAINVRFFPFFKLKSYARLFFIGGGAGMAWIKEDYDNLYSRDPNLPIGYYGYGGISESTSQWSPVFRAMIGVTGTGGQFGFGGEIRYNIISLKQEADSPFRTRVAKNFNSVDLTLRFYFSL